jgi:hypothetical protein
MLSSRFRIALGEREWLKGGGFVTVRFQSVQTESGLLEDL